MMRILFGKIRFFRILICPLIFVSTFVLVKAQQNEARLIKSETNLVQNLLVFDALWEKVNTKYFDAGFNGIDWLKMREIYRPKAEKATDKTQLLAILKQMLAELKTSHLDIWQTVGKKQIEQKILTKFNPRTDVLQLNFGFNLRKIENKVVVTEVAPSLSAPKIGWILLSSDGKSVSDNDFTVGEVYEGRKITYKFLDLENKEQSLTFQAEWQIKTFILVSQTLSENIGYIRFEGFTSDIGKWLQNELAKMNSTTGLILDLRGNRGGYVNEVKKCLSAFFTYDTEFGTFIERSGKAKTEKIKGSKEKAYKGKLVVLVDDESFSGSEIFAGLIKETNRGQIVGTPTKGLVLNSIEYSLPSDFKVSIAFRDYLSPNGYRIEGKGITPTFEIPLKIENIIKNRDLALEKALEIIK